jgi:hypothetical protein
MSYGTLTATKFFFVLTNGARSPWLRYLPPQCNFKNVPYLISSYVHRQRVDVDPNPDPTFNKL